MDIVGFRLIKRVRRKDRAPLARIALLLLLWRFLPFLVVPQVGFLPFLAVPDVALIVVLVTVLTLMPAKWANDLVWLMTVCLIMLLDSSALLFPLLVPRLMRARQVKGSAWLGTVPPIMLLLDPSALLSLALVSAVVPELMRPKRVKGCTWLVPILLTVKLLDWFPALMLVSATALVVRMLIKRVSDWKWLKALVIVMLIHSLAKGLELSSIYATIFGAPMIALITVMLMVRKSAQQEQRPNFKLWKSSKYILPEDWCANLEDVRQREINAGRPNWVIQIVTIRCLFELLWAAIQISLENLWRPDEKAKPRE